MKKLILLLVLGIFLINFISFVMAAENCELALPRYGVVQCINVGQSETIPSTALVFSSCGDGTKCSLQLSCLSNCQLIESNEPGWSSPMNWPNKCSLPNSRKFEVVLNGVSKGAVSSTSWSRDDNLIVRAWCEGPFGGIYAPPSGTSIQYTQDKIMLKEGWAGSLPDTPISGSEGCILNSQISEETNVDNYYDPTSSTLKSKKTSTYSSLNNFPTNWKIGDHYIFVKDWQTGVADISVTTDKNNNQYWCGGQYGSRKIYQIQKITSSSGKCYAIPQGVLSIVECCFPSDCVDKYGPQYTCNPDNWKCEKTKPCNSQVECDQTFGAGVCQNKQINQWTCDITKKWGNYAGTCINSIKNVEQCPSDCTTDEYYNDQEGKCKSRTVLLTCPANSCCLIGGDYKEKSCDIGQCCVAQSSFVGICAADCSTLTEEELQNMALKSQTSSSLFKSSTGKTILIFLIILIASSIGFFIYVKNKKDNKKLKDRVEKDIQAIGKHCTKCGNLLKSVSKFCTKCGRRVR